MNRVICSVTNREVSMDYCRSCALNIPSPCGYDYALIKRIHDALQPRDGIHVTDLVGCLKRTWYEETEPLPERPSDVMYRILGTATHALLEDEEDENLITELPLEYEGIVGRVDAYYLTSDTLIDYKCQPEGELISMADGTEKFIEDIDIFDEVIGGDGKPDRVVAIVDGGVQEVLEIKIASGQIIRVSANHPVLTEEGNFITEDGCWKKASELEVGDHVFQLMNYTGDRKVDPDDARLLGYLVGDGGLTNKYSVRFSNKDEDIIEDFTAIANSKGWEVAKVSGDNCDYRIHNNGKRLSATRVTNFLKEYGLHQKNSHNKVVPEQIMQASKEAIGNFLGGYFDADGSITDPDGAAPCRVTFATVSRELGRQVSELLRRVGIENRVYSYGLKDRYENTIYQICVWRASEVIKFFETLNIHSRSKVDRFERWRPSLEEKSSMGKRLNRIDEIKSLGEMQTIGLEIERTHQYYTSGILTHNTTRWLMPAKLPYGDHELQVNIYRWLLENNGYPVNRMFLHYIDLSGPSKCRTCKLPLTKEPEGFACPKCGRIDHNAHHGTAMVNVPFMLMDEVEEFVLSRKEALLESLETGAAPEATPGFLCNYCQFYKVCPDSEAG